MGVFLLNKLSVKTPFLLQEALHWLSTPLLTHSVLNNLLLLLLNFFSLLQFSFFIKWVSRASFVFIGGHVPFPTIKTIIAEE